MMDPLIDRGEYAALTYCTYLNQASLGLIPRTSLEASVRFLADVAQHGNLRLSDQAEARVLDGLREAAAELLGAPAASVAVVGGASEGLGQLAALLSSAGGEVVLVSSDFPSVTYPWLAARDRLGMHIRWVRDTPARDLTLSLGDAISDRTTVVCVSPVQFATGSQVDVAALVARARDVGARVVVDVTQMAGAAPVTMTQWGVDALVCSGYKWLSAPSGVALLAITEDLAAATPVIVGWKGSATPFDFTPQELSLAAGEPIRIQFSPHLIPVNRGILTTLYAAPGKHFNTAGEMNALAQQIEGAFREAYGSEPFVRLLEGKTLPDTKNVVGTNVIEIAWRLDPRTGRLIVMSAEDNIVKGASGQAVQSMNVMCGFPETAGLV